ncbi:MAG: ribonuclease J [Thermoanaerobaculia bacterium]
MSEEVEITPLGGFGEFGKNCLVFRFGGEAIVVDAGISFPDESSPGVDRIAPDFASLASDRITGIFLTHGHEDHIGALPRLREISRAPVFGTGFTRALARRRLLEAGLGGDLSRVGIATSGIPISAGGFSVTFLPVSHSVPQSSALLIEVGGRRILHTGDFKLDEDGPENERTSLPEFAVRAGGCDLLILDSTNAEREGRCPSEREARDGLRASVRGVRGRVLVTTFSSHVARMQAAVDAARAAGRGITILGKSMREIGEIAEGSGNLAVPAGWVADPDRLEDFDPSRLLVLCSGSQGEPHSALSRLSEGRHDRLTLEEGDLAIFSARTIPGRERAVARVVDGLLRRGVRIASPGGGDAPPVHVSGHAYRDDLRAVLEAVRPRAVLPAHGERRALLACGEIAGRAGVSSENVLICDNGDSVFLSGDAFRVTRGARRAGSVALDASAGGEISEASLHERRLLGSRGVVFIGIFRGPAELRVEVGARGLAGAHADAEAEVAREVKSALLRGESADLANPAWIESTAQLAAKRACRKAFGIPPMIAVMVPRSTSDFLPSA